MRGHRLGQQDERVPSAPPQWQCGASGTAPAALSARLRPGKQPEVSPTSACWRSNVRSSSGNGRHPMCVPSPVLSDDELVVGRQLRQQPLPCALANCASHHHAVYAGHLRRGFRRWTYLTQVQQAMAYETAIAHWRRLKHDAEARTMGVLYWQLNDVWQVRNLSHASHPHRWCACLHGKDSELRSRVRTTRSRLRS